MLPSISRDITNTEEYIEGIQAFRDSVDVDDCPYKSHYRDKATQKEGDKRMAWMAGWYDAQQKQKFPKLFNSEHPEYVGKS